MTDNITHFGFKTINKTSKSSMVDHVFDQVANRYDLMNDLMSLGLHRSWKAQTITAMNLSPEDKVLDLAGGTGDLTIAIANKVRHPRQLYLCDRNIAMLQQGLQRTYNKGLLVNTVTVDGHHLPFTNNYFDHIVIGFGLRNMTDQNQVLKSCHQVLKKSGKLTVLEFSHPPNSMWQWIYDQYSFHIIPKIGAMITQSQESYDYLVESIRMHPKPEVLKTMFTNAGFSNSHYQLLTGGIVAIHQGVKP